MEQFVFDCPVRTYSGKGIMKNALQSELRSVGENILLAYGGGSIIRNGIYHEIREILDACSKKVTELSGIEADPPYEKVCEGAELCRMNHIDFILAVGGGSVADCCKVISAQTKLEMDIWEYECVQRRIPSAFVPMGAVMTAFGTGSEQNNSGVITNRQAEEKRSLKGVFPTFAILDTECTRTLPLDLLKAGAFDTLSHCMETYFSLPNRRVVSDEINEAVMRNVIDNLRILQENPQDWDARSELAWDSALAMNGILKVGKRTAFQAHQIAHQIGAYTGFTHGKVLSIVQPVYYRHTYSCAMEKFAEFARNVWRVNEHALGTEETAVKGIDELEKFISEIGLPGTFSELGGISEYVLDKVAETTYIMDTSCEKLTIDMLKDILRESLPEKGHRVPYPT